ncbi:MAG: hypothetical protein COT74_11625 [Bdellovibrionales bacterium CG10_big_fil_rev_8_21_14_0_10_45_34]|nr:MAG: hypothetical protein COT74_11625 [Bdellovibrionales bacterium CG10_big_fil_rev_8_21_14_0_10_45_34]
MSATAKKQLFKYVDIAGATAILQNGTLLFSSPLYFNDPFDISIQTLFGYDAFDLEAHLDEFIALSTSDEVLPEGNGSAQSDIFVAVRSALSNASESYRANLRKEFFAKKIWDEESLRASGAETLAHIKTAFELSGIFCASKRFDNYLLWAHYAEKHQGAVLEFSPNVEKDSMLILAEDVEYTNNRPYLYESHKDFLIKSMFRKTEDILAEYTKKITKTKSLEWAYEEEIRLYMPILVNLFEGKKNHCLTYHDDELASVYLGCKMPKETKDSIVDLAINRNPEARIYEMIPDPHHYKLKPKPYA